MATIFETSHQTKDNMSSIRLDKFMLCFHWNDIVQKARFLTNRTQDKCLLVRIDFSDIPMEQFSLSMFEMLQFSLISNPSAEIDIKNLHQAGASSVCGTSCLKEVVLGVSDSRAMYWKDNFKAVASKSTCLGTLLKIEAINFRVIPSLTSTLIFETTSTLGDIEKAFNNTMYFASIGKSGTSMGERRMLFRDISGFDIRFTEEYEERGHFYEAPECTESDAASFDREDMGEMACISVVGMEFKDRMKKDPFRVLRDLQR